MPPQFEIGFPEARRIVELAQPPAADRNQDDDHELQPVTRNQRPSLELEDQRVREKNVPGPDNGSEPMADELIAAE